MPCKMQFRLAGAKSSSERSLRRLVLAASALPELLCHPQLHLGQPVPLLEGSTGGAVPVLSRQARDSGSGGVLWPA